MRKVILLFVLAAMLISLIAVNGFAAEKEMTVTYFEDGSYIVDTIEVSLARASGSTSGSKTRSYYDNDGVLNWKAVLSGSFTYNDSGATCTSSSVSVTVYDSSWYTISKSSSKSGNTASASVTMDRKVLGVTVEQKAVSISLSCDKNGNLS